MSKNLANVNPVLITASLTSSGVELAYEGDSLCAELLIELDENYSTELKIGDFVHTDDVLHNVYVYEADETGGLSGPWVRVSGSACSGSIAESRAPLDIDMWVLAVADGSPAPSVSTVGQAEQAGGKPLKAKIRKKGPLPLPPGLRRVKRPE
jgi:hypothetical protein